jgi:hypothetical protein
MAKPGNEFGLAGPKYMERALRGFMKELAEGMGEALKKYWSGKAGKRRRGGKGRGRRR